MKLKIMMGKLLYPIVKWLPASYHVGGGIAKRLRYYFGRMVMDGNCGINVNIERGAYFTRLLRMGNHSVLGINCYISGDVTIGDHVLMGPNVSILTGNHNFKDKSRLIGEQGSESRPVEIGNDVWIGCNCIILPGVHIADGCVIGAGAVVTKDTEPYTVVGGNPARIIGYRE